MASKFRIVTTAGLVWGAAGRELMRVCEDVLVDGPREGQETLQSFAGRMLAFPYLGRLAWLELFTLRDQPRYVLDQLRAFKEKLGSDEALARLSAGQFAARFAEHVGVRIEHCKEVTLGSYPRGVINSEQEPQAPSDTARKPATPPSAADLDEDIGYVFAGSLLTYVAQRNWGGPIDELTAPEDLVGFVLNCCGEHWDIISWVFSKARRKPDLYEWATFIHQNRDDTPVSKLGFLNLYALFLDSCKDIRDTKRVSDLAEIVNEIVGEDLYTRWEFLVLLGHCLKSDNWHKTDCRTLKAYYRELSSLEDLIATTPRDKDGLYLDHHTEAQEIERIVKRAAGGSLAPVELRALYAEVLQCLGIQSDKETNND